MTTKYTKNFALALPDFRTGPWHDLLNGDITKLDQLIYGAISSVDTPPWANSTHYVVGVSIFDANNGTTWMNLVDHTSSATGTFADERTAHPTWWTQLLVGFAPRGEWAHVTEYFPYDLTYQTSECILALCKTRHTSNLSGTIRDDAVMWSILIDFGALSSAAAVGVSYDPTTSGLAVTNVQAAIDKVETQVVALNNVNITQGEQIGAIPMSGTPPHPVKSLQQQIDDNKAAITALGNTSDSTYLKIAGGQTTNPGGFAFTSKNLGNLANFTVNALQGNYQYGSNVGAVTITAPTIDSAVDILITNSATAGAITFFGFTAAVGNVGDALTTTNGHRFLVSIRRIASVSTYIVKALQ